MASNLSEPKYILVNSTSDVEALIVTIQQNQDRPIFIDVEGNNLGRNGSIAILQLFIPNTKVYIIDIHVLGDTAFKVPCSTGMTLQAILESPNIPKVFFDVRNDSDALFAHFRVKLEGVRDLQVLEFATRRVPGKFLSGLSKCIEKDSQLTQPEIVKWRETKDAGKRMFLPDQGGSYDVFFQRPLSKQLLEYCVQDVTFLPGLLTKYLAKLTPVREARVKDETLQRIRASQQASYDGKGSHKSLGPW